MKETLDLLDGAFLGVSQGVAEGGYALWLGSGISRDRVIGLDGVLAKLIEFLRSNTTAAVDCAYRNALEKVLALATPSAEERASIDFGQPALDWPCLPSLLSRLWKQYADVLSVEVGTEKLDYLLWVGLDFANTFATQNPDAEHLVIGMLALEGVITELATANWDGLLEAAIRELGYRCLLSGHRHRRGSPWTSGGSQTLQVSWLRFAGNRARGQIPTVARRQIGTDHRMDEQRHVQDRP